VSVVKSFVILALGRLALGIGLAGHLVVDECLDCHSGNPRVFFGFFSSTAPSPPSSHPGPSRAPPPRAPHRHPSRASPPRAPHRHPPPPPLASSWPPSWPSCCWPWAWPPPSPPPCAARGGPS